MSASLHPSAIKPITNSTESRVPRMTGLPTSTSGAIAMRGCSVTVDGHSAFRLLTLLELVAGRNTRNRTPESRSPPFAKRLPRRLFRRSDETDGLVLLELLDERGEV